MAKDSLKQLITDPKSDAYWVELSWNLPCEQLFEDFRRSNDPIVKSTALEETKKLLTKLSEVLGDDFKVAKSPISLLLAGMPRKLGPAPEWHDVLQAAFQSCVDDLRRRLERLDQLPAPGARAHLYVIDAKVRKSDLAKQTVLEQGPSTSEEQQGGQQPDKPGESPEAATQDDGEAGVAKTMGSVDATYTGQQQTNTSPAGQPEPAAPAAAAPVISGGRADGVDSDPMSEGLLGIVEFYCKYCRKDATDWAHGGAYLCLYCIDCDICEECFDKRAARLRGELEADWRTICPQDHKHIRAPVEGWRGVTGCGVLRLSGGRSGTGTGWTYMPDVTFIGCIEGSIIHVIIHKHYYSYATGVNVLQSS
ncbi:hypothetical protein FJTKL_12172 [Diaporthe vaccinii]|uniref:ZZ-type domain-containing protein n=1 Tax=Diaporthe vaccinii TaxID=105482 RepID=A0ABR4EEJ9_9PEZI